MVESYASLCKIRRIVGDSVESAIPLAGGGACDYLELNHESTTPEVSGALMIYLVAIFLPPLALLLYGKIFQAIFNFLLCVLAIVLGLLFIVLPGAPFVILWGIAVLHAVLAVNSAKQDARAREVADAMRGRR